MTKREQLIEYIDSLDAYELIELHNSYCEAAGYGDDRIYSMWDLDELLEGRTPTDILCMSFHGDFNPHHSYFWFNGYGNLESVDYVAGTPICAEDIADYVLRREDSLGNDEIKEILDEDEEYEQED